jgi:hypothetical protein
VTVCLQPVASGNGRNNVRITVMAAANVSLLAKDINNNILAALPVEKMSAQALYNQWCVVQPGINKLTVVSSVFTFPGWST